MTTKREAKRQFDQENTLMSLGFTQQEAESLRRISMTLHSWHERECGTDNGCIERDEETNKAYWLNSNTMKRYPIRDMEAGAMNRLHAIISARNARPQVAQGDDKYDGNLSAYVQTDPRGAALYILRPGDVPAGESADGYYSRGICVY